MLLTVAVVVAGVYGSGFARVSRGGPLDGGKASGSTLVRVNPGDTFSVGGLWVKNPGPDELVLQSVEVISGGGGLRPSSPVRVSGPERIEVLGDAGFMTYYGPPPANMPLSDPEGFVIRPGADRTEVVYTIVVPPAPHSWVAGIGIRYRVGHRQYKKRFDSILSLCTKDFVGECPDHAPGD